MTEQELDALDSRLDEAIRHEFHRTVARTLSLARDAIDSLRAEVIELELREANRVADNTHRTHILLIKAEADRDALLRMLMTLAEKLCQQHDGEIMPEDAWMAATYLTEVVNPYLDALPHQGSEKQ